MLAFVVHTELIPLTGWGLSAPWPLISNVASQPGGLRAAFGLHFDWRIVRELCGPGAHPFADVGGQGVQQCR